MTGYQVNNKKKNPESFENRSATEASYEGKERKLEFLDKYASKLEKALGKENSNFFITIENLYERYGDIEIAVKESFKQIKGSESYAKEVDKLISLLTSRDEVDKNLEGNTDNEYWKYSIYYPIIERLKTIKGVKVPDDLFKEKNKFNLQKNVIGIINSLDDEKLKKSLLDFLSTDLDSEKETRKVTEETMKESDYYKDFSGDPSKKPVESDNFDILIANNYIKFPGDTTYEKEKNLITALDITKNKIIEGEDPEFKDRNLSLIKEIESSTESDKKKSLTRMLYDESLKDDGIKASSTNKQRSKVGETKLQDSNHSSLHFENLKKLLKEHNQNVDIKLENQETLSKLINELSQIDEALDIFLIKNPNNPTGLKLKEEIDKLIQNPKNINRPVIEQLTLGINTLQNS